MPSWNRRKKKIDGAVDVTAMATGGRYLPRLTDYHSSSTIVRSVTTVRKSEQIKGSRSHSVPSLNTVDMNGRHLSPSRTPRSNSVRAKKFSFKRRFAKLFGSHSDLSGKGSIISNERSSTGVYRPIGGFRPHSIGGSSDCSTSSLTSVPPQSEFSRHNSLRDSSRSKISQSSVFSGSRQASYDSADAINYTVHGNTTVPSESGLRPRSIACMQRSGSSSSLRTNALHSVNDPRYHSIAAFPPRIDTSESFIRSVEERRGYRQIVHRDSHDDQESTLEESESVKPSDPEYKKVAENLMSCSPQPRIVDEHSPSYTSHKVQDTYSENSRKYSGDLTDEPVGTNCSPRLMPHNQGLEDRGRSRTPEPGSLHSIVRLPPGWEGAETSTGLKYYVDHNTQNTYWKLPNEPDDVLSLPDGWELVESKQYGTYYVNHNNRTAQYQHPIYSRPPPPYNYPLHGEEDDNRRAPTRSHSHRSSQVHRVMDPNASLPRRCRSFRDPSTDTLLESNSQDEEVLHTRQLSTMTFVPPSPFQVAEIPQWLKNYVEAPFGSDKDKQIPWTRYPPDDLSGLDTMIKRLLKKNSEQLVKKFEYYRVALQQEMDGRQREQNRLALQKETQNQKVSHYLHHQPHSPSSHSMSPMSTPFLSVMPRPPNGISLSHHSSLGSHDSIVYSPTVPSSVLNHNYSNYQQHLDITLQPPPHFNNTPGVSNYPSINTTTTNDVYHGCEETFV